MSLPSDKYGPRLSDATAVDQADPFEVTDRTSPVQSRGRGTQLSNPPTAIVRREGFHELPPGAVVGDNYEIELRLGAGAMGEVYSARHMRLGKRVAIKVIGKRLSEDAAAIERFAMEARALAQIQHPSIVAVEHVGELSDGRAFFVMEFLRGQSLYDRLQRGRLPLAEALRVIDQIARGLEAAHAEGIIHRDLKPENTFLVHLPGELPAVKLVDFGLAKLAADHADIDRRAERTQSGVAIGTPMYMSPEQARGPDVDHRTDVYALGCVAYELLLGVSPFPHAKTAPELFAAHLAEAPPLPRSVWPEIPPQLDLMLFAMVAKDPAHRPTLMQVRAVITAAGAARPAETSQRAATEFVGRRQPRRNLTITALVLAALVGGIAIGVTATKSERKAAPVSAPSIPTAERESSAPVEEKPPVAIETPIEVAPRPAPQTPRTIVVPRAATPRAPIEKTPPTRPAVIVDAGIDDAAPAPVQKAPEKQPEKQIDKTKPFNPNQTINPFDKKRDKANP